LNLFTFTSQESTKIRDSAQAITIRIMSDPQTRQEPSAPLNPNASAFLSRWKGRTANPAILAEGILKGDRVMLSRAITLVESEHEDHQAIAGEVVRRCLPHSGKSVRIAVTGSPGSGKSTFIEAFGHILLSEGHTVAVLAIDPSSSLSKGSILGDKTRMQTLSANPNVYVRPSPAGDALGGVARKTRESIILCEAAGFDRILVETVGVGQSEHTVSSMTDLFILILLPGAGDELQGIKRGIVEMADLLVVNKVDGERVALGRQTRQAYRNALHLLAPADSGWTPKVLSCSAQKGEGLEEVALAVREFVGQSTENGFLASNRTHQAVHWFQETLLEQLKRWFFHHPRVAHMMPEVLKSVEEGRQSPFQAAHELVRLLNSVDPHRANQSLPEV
jgi:LAO/AO transport system kinase